MTNEKRETAIKWLQNEIRSLRLAPTINGCGPENWADLLEIMQTCLEAVKGCFVDTNKMSPLTLNQLREMGGQPYWHVGLQKDSPEAHWKILDPFVARCPEDYGYGKRWLAYAYQPAHIDREAWEPCGECERKSCDNCRYSEYLSYLEPCKSCENASKWKPMQNFCGECGRPLTPEAWAMLEKRLRG